MKAHLEAALEEYIEAHLVGHGWHQGDPSSYSRALGLDTVEPLTFLGASQQEKWAKLVTLHGSPDLAQSKFERRLADELPSRGVIDVLRKGVKDLGVHFDKSGRIEHSGKPGDGGIDGIMPPQAGGAPTQDPLGLDRVYMQAKRYARVDEDFFDTL